MSCNRHSFEVAGSTPIQFWSSVDAATRRPDARILPRAAVAAILALGSASAQIGENYCTAVPNSTGLQATISGSGSAEVSTNILTLTSTRLPLNQSAYFLCSRAWGIIANPGGSAGNICLGSPIGRMVGGVVANSGATGSVSVLTDLNAMPQPSGAVVVLAGESWRFQCWYRDSVSGGGSTSNFSNGLRVQFSGPPTPVPTMVIIPAGSFLMGSDAPNSAPYYNLWWQQPAHQVTISYSFWMSQHEATQAEYMALMGVVLPSFGATHPVEAVSWNQARAYCAALTAHQAANIPAGYEYRLPTEAEWEYACRAGTTTEFHYGPDLFCGQARFNQTNHTNPPSSCGSMIRAVPVGSYLPNAFGLFDMHGNVWEWCLDSLAPYSSASVTDPFVTGGQSKLHRGGGWDSPSDSCRSARRATAAPDETYGALGFRVVLAPVLVP
jgi:formylglycine-generating enzyme required for sulfatase activity